MPVDPDVPISCWLTVAPGPKAHLTARRLVGVYGIGKNNCSRRFRTSRRQILQWDFGLDESARLVGLRREKIRDDRGDIVFAAVLVGQINQFATRRLSTAI